MQTIVKPTKYKESDIIITIAEYNDVISQSFEDLLHDKLFVMVFSPSTFGRISLLPFGSHLPLVPHICVSESSQNW